MKYEIGHPVKVIATDFYQGIRGLIKDEFYSNTVLCYIISITDSEEFKRKYPYEISSNSIKEKVYEKEELTIAHYNLECDLQHYRNEKINKILQ